MWLKCARLGREICLRSAPPQNSTTLMLGWRGLAAAIAACVTVASTSGASARAQNPGSASLIACPPVGAAFSNPPEIRTANGALKGTVFLYDEQQRLPTSVSGAVTCSPQFVRNFRATPPIEPRDPNDLRDPMPGPTLRARVGDLVQLVFINQIDSGHFERALDIEDCASVNKGTVYPSPFRDIYPNCLHASLTANIHFHGTHTNPNSTGDNVFLQIRPLPRDNRGNLTTTAAQVMVGLEDYFKTCAGQLKTTPLHSWPVTWRDLPAEWTHKQTSLLREYQDKNPSQRLWDEDEKVRQSDGWPVYYIGAFPYCFALPAYPGPSEPSPVMGQLPGTDWYHAHKHGSTAVNVMNGMTGAFIIEGKYDDDLNDAYGSYTLLSGPWNTRSQNVMVLNQLATVPNALNNSSGPSGGGIDFSVNGRVRPTVHMQPGEIQLWRIINASSRTAIYFMPPEGLQWRQIAQDGVQYDNANYQESLNRPFYMAPANRVDLLVKAPRAAGAPHTMIRVQNVMSRSQVDIVPGPTTDVRELLAVEVAGPSVTKDEQPTEMMFLSGAPEPPRFLTDISDEELRRAGSIRRTFEFSSKRPGNARQHTINGIQFGDQGASINIALGAVEEWKIVNTTTDQPNMNGKIDHPLHIHINPFQVTEFFDPNEIFVDKATGKAIPRYLFEKSAALTDGQCRVNMDDETTWRPCSDTKQGHWWDVFAIPAARVENGRVIPGYYKMRSRFVDYPGAYVMHCHILIHEDRGMMYTVEVVKPITIPAHHLEH